MARLLLLCRFFVKRNTEVVELIVVQSIEGASPLDAVKEAWGCVFPR